MSTHPTTYNGASFSLSTITGFIKEMAGRRSQRLALRELMTMGPHRLDDLGIDLGDVVEAIRCPSAAGRILEDRRAERAVQMTTPTEGAPHAAHLSGGTESWH